MNKRLQLSQAQRFGIRFFTLLIAVSVLSWGAKLPDRLGTVQCGLAQAAVWLAHVVESTSSVLKDQIQVGAMSLDVNYECTGVYVLLILFTFLFAYPASWRSRISGVIVGVVALTAINIFRISVLVRVAEIEPELFGYFHEYVWQGVFLILVIAYAMAWVERVR